MDDKVLFLSFFLSFFPTKFRFSRFRIRELLGRKAVNYFFLVWGTVGYPGKADAGRTRCGLEFFLWKKGGVYILPHPPHRPHSPTRKKDNGDGQIPSGEEGQWISVTLG